jgi:hypothetical protein
VASGRPDHDAIAADYAAGRSLAEIAERHGLDGPEAAVDAVREALGRLDARILAGLEATRGSRYSP